MVGGVFLDVDSVARLWRGGRGNLSRRDRRVRSRLWQPTSRYLERDTIAQILDHQPFRGSEVTGVQRIGVIRVGPIASKTPVHGFVHLGKTWTVGRVCLWRKVTFQDSGRTSGMWAEVICHQSKVFAAESAELVCVVRSTGVVEDWRIRSHSPMSSTVSLSFT